MKKRWIAVIMALCLLWLLPACSNDPARRVEKAMKRTAALESCGMLLDVELAVAGAEAALTLSAELAVNRRDGSMNAAATVTKNGKSQSAAVYQVGEWFYVTANSTSFKSRVPDFTEKYDYLTAVEALLREYPQTVWENVEMEGETALFSPDGTTLSTLFLPLAESLWQARPGQDAASDGTAFTLSGGTLQMTVDGDYVTACALTLELKGEDVVLIGTVTLQIPVPGSDVTVMPPLGYQYYPEYDLS
ncbi:MAG: hypothetical protein E7644_00445 [Ruminococcaceae bacterium]|nr:hypothetical protein [Oscillospiraceae bacterium]